MIQEGFGSTWTGVRRGRGLDADAIGATLDLDGSERE